MICPNCGMKNIEGSKFCVKCGGNLSDAQSNQNFESFNQENVQQQTVNYSEMQQGLQPTQQMNYSQVQQGSQPTQQMNYSQVQQGSQPTQQMNYSTSQQTVKNTNNSGAKMSISEYLFVVLAVILKPFTAFKQELDKFNDFKNSAILSLMVSIIATVISLVKTMFNAVRVTSFWSSKTEWVWENLKNINYIKIIGTNLLIYLGIIVAIACVYYVGSLIVKKQTNFSRLLGISAVAVVPMILCSMIISPLLSMIYAPLGMGATIVGGVYTIIIIYEIINNEIKMEGNAKLYFNLICMSILAVAGYYLYMKFFMSSISSSLNNILDIFG